ncbi:MAG: glycosyltransferase family 4 protein [Verrucomicrobia bacterium]|nr:glycosyltransferase family 4 protein [Verrucomicrobiota bacterium]
MRIAVLGGIAQSLVNFRGQFLSALVRRGHEVHTIAGEESVDVRKQLAALGVWFHPIQLRRSTISPFHDVATILALARVFRRWRADMLFSYTIKPVVYGSIVARLTGVSRCFSLITGLGYCFMDGSLMRKALNFLVRLLYRLALPLNEVVFFQNPDDKRLFVNLGLLGSRGRAVVVDGSGVDLKYFAEAPLPLKPVRFLLVARLIREKGICEYLEAARKLKRKHVEASFRLVGPEDAGRSSIPKTQLAAIRREGIVDYLGEVKDVRSAIADASVCVLPSYREGLPRSVVEAMAMGRPVITTDVPGCRETVSPGVNGFLIPSRDSELLANAMERFVRDPDLVVQMGRRSREIAVSRFDVDRINALMLQEMGLVEVQTRLAIAK